MACTPFTLLLHSLFRWSAREHNIFVDGLAKHGRQWTRIARLIGTRTGLQTRTHAQKVRWGKGQGKGRGKGRGKVVKDGHRRVGSGVWGQAWGKAWGQAGLKVGLKVKLKVGWYILMLPHNSRFCCS